MGVASLGTADIDSIAEIGSSKFTLVWDSKFRVDIPANEVPAPALREIQQVIRNEYGSVDFGKYFDWSWQVDKGPLTGKLPGRIADYIYKNFGNKLPLTTVERIGNVVKRHMPSAGNETIVFSFAKNIDWGAGKFGDGQSCFWTSRKDCRDNIKANKGFAVQFWNPATPDTGKGRCWGALAENDSVIVLYNAYGVALSEMARALSSFFKCDYRSVNLYINGSTSETVYVNSGTGYVLGQSKTIEALTSSYNLPYKRNKVCHYCRHADSETTMLDGRDFCKRCTSAFTRVCHACRATVWYNRARQVRLSYGSNQFITLCDSCSHKYCNSCGKVEKEPILKYNFINAQHAICGECESKSIALFLDISKAK